jgi:putative DNA primase/helicase
MKWPVAEAAFLNVKRVSCGAIDSLREVPSRKRRSKMTAFYPENISAEIKALDQWDCYKLETVEGKKTKVPYNPATGQRADSTKSDSWVAFNAALAAYQDLGIYDGICFFLTRESGIVFIDLDNCINDGEIEPWALEIVKRFNSYTERSQSGRGLHILIKGVKPGTRCRRAAYQYPVEIYDHARQCCLTGDLVAV